MRIKDLSFSIRLAVIKEIIAQGNELPSLEKSVDCSFIFHEVPTSRFRTLQTPEQVDEFWRKVIYEQNRILFYREYIFTLNPPEYKTISVGEETFNI